MFSSSKRVCKVYIHDLDVKSEVRIRQKILMCGADNATQVRFDGDVSDADIWILNEGSAFKAVAQKRQKVSKFVLWTSKNTDLYSSDGIQENLLTAENLAVIVDGIVTGRKISVNKLESSPDKPQKVQATQSSPTSKIAKLIKNGVDERKGLLCIENKQAQLHFDFANSIVHYNDAAKSLLWDDVALNASLEDFTVSKSAPSAQSFAYNCSMFSAIWQICHRDSGGSLIEPLDRNSVLELKSWPTFELVEHEYDHCRIASFLQKRSLSAEQVIKLMKLDNNLVNRFYNAIYLSSYASFNEAAAGLTVSDSQVENSGGGLASLWRKVRGAMQFAK